MPDVLANHQPPPTWREWNSHLLQLITPSNESVLVGHSSASALIADLAGKLPCQCLVIVDGDVPPSQGAASPVRPALRDFIAGLAGPDGRLPIWSRWSGDTRRASIVGLDMLASDPIAFAAFENGLPELSVDWFDDTIELANWDHIPAGFIQTSEIYDQSIGSMTRSNSQTGIISPLASFRLPRSMIIRPRRPCGGDGQFHVCRARIFIPRSIQARPPVLSLPCPANSFHTLANSPVLIRHDSIASLFNGSGGTTGSSIYLIALAAITLIATLSVSETAHKPLR